MIRFTILSLRLRLLSTGKSIGHLRQNPKSAEQAGRGKHIGGAGKHLLLGVGECEIADARGR